MGARRGSGGQNVGRGIERRRGGGESARNVDEGRKERSAAEKSAARRRWERFFDERGPGFRRGESRGVAMFLATLAGSASSAERSSVLRADGRRLRAVDERLDGSANSRGRSTGLDDAGLFDGGLREFPERADRVGAGLRVVVSAVRNRLRVDGNDVERRLSGVKRFDFGSR